MPVRAIHSPKLWTCVEHLLREEDEHVCVLPMTTFIKPVRVINLLQTDTTVTAAPTPCPPGSVNLEPCRDLDLDLTTGKANWVLVSAPASSGLTTPRPAPVVAEHGAWTTAIPGADWVGYYPGIGTPGDYTFELRFSLCCAFSNPQGEIALRSDNGAKVYLNEHLIAEEGGAFNVATGMSVPLAPHGHLLHVGDNNTLRVVVHNQDMGEGKAGPVGLILSGRLTAKEGQSA